MLLKTFFRASLPWVLSLAAAGAGLSAQAIRETRPGTPQTEVYSQPEAATQESLPLKKLSLFSSGVGYFQHSGTIAGSGELALPFSAEAVNDALKSLVIKDPGSSPAVSYPSEQTLYQTLRSLSVDLLGSTNILDLLNSLKGAEIEAALPQPVRGRIMFAEHRLNPKSESSELYLSLYTDQGLRTIEFREMKGFAFTNPKLNADLTRALDLLMQSRDSDTRMLIVRLPGQASRNVSLSYVIPAPIWKVSYRLDLSQSQPFLQGWAIVDNDGDTDWENIELSLVTGRPVSFIQNLYPPYRVPRQVVPLGIAGAAEARSYASGESASSAADDKIAMKEAPQMSYSTAPNYSAPRASVVTAGAGETAQAQAAGDWFEFTIKKPVTLARRQSAMLPLVEGTVQAAKTLIFSGAKAAPGRPINPAVGAELVNTAGMKLPAGPITVYDGGTYAGDALIEFLPEGEKRLIAYGEDLSVTGSGTQISNRLVSSVTIRQGIMTIRRTLTYEKTYVFRNAGNETKRLIIEHPISAGTALIEPASYDEKTDTLYRFTCSLPQGSLNFTVREERPLTETITLAQLPLNSFVSYTANQEIPAEARRALEGAIALKQKADEAKKNLTELETRRTRLLAEQERTRKNLEAAGGETPPGQEYLKRLAAQDADIDALDETLGRAEQTLRAAEKDYDAYLAELSL
ncbi:MAG: DUF4139 domain-containing protein [Spirochaetaceae bacterium]|nr:DUF4139 domain-containing protein [Spirochaetaceae bacterium]